MQKLVYLSNSRDYTEQGDINENKYFKRVNSLLDEGWKVSHIVENTIKLHRNHNPIHNESYVAFVLLEKNEDDT